MTVLGAALRLLLGAVLARGVALAVVAPEIPRLSVLTAVVIAAVTLWRPGIGLLIAAGLTAAGALLAAAPARVAEIFAWAFLAGWLLRIWRPLSPAGWPLPIALPAALYMAVVVASWLALSVGSAAGVAPVSLPWFLLWSVPPDHLIFSSPEPETWTMLQNVTGVGFFLAALAITRHERGLVTGLAATLTIAMAVLAVLTLADVGRQWADTGYQAWFLRRFVDGERTSLHLEDLNAAASLYALAGLTALALGVSDRGRRLLSGGLAVLMLPALLLAGSVSALIAATVVGAVTLGPVARMRRWQPTRTQVATTAAVIVFAVAVSALLASRRGDGRATVSEAMAQRSGFLETSGRMFASAPLFGVGIGRYFDRSAEFLPSELRDFYGNENAHNYFAQQFAELGVVGGSLFIWLAAAVVGRGRRSVTSPAADGAVLGLLAGTGAYLLTCLTGHPLLVSEAALPFWAAFGAVAGSGTGGKPSPPTAVHKVGVAAVALLLAIHVGTAALSATRAQTPPPERGFHGLEADDTGEQFRWMTRHAVAYIPAGQGIVTLRLRGPDDIPEGRPLIIEIAIAGRLAGRRELPAGRWVAVDIGVRAAERMPFRRIDLRANQQWTQTVGLGRRRAQRPISAMVGAISWTSTDPVR